MNIPPSPILMVPSTEMGVRVLVTLVVAKTFVSPLITTALAEEASE